MVRSRPGSSRDHVDVLLPAFVHNIVGPERLKRPDVACGLDLARDSVRYLLTTMELPILCNNCAGGGSRADFQRGSLCPSASPSTLTASSKKARSNLSRENHCPSDQTKLKTTGHRNRSRGPAPARKDVIYDITIVLYGLNS